MKPLFILVKTFHGYWSTGLRMRTWQTDVRWQPKLTKTAWTTLNLIKPTKIFLNPIHHNFLPLCLLTTVLINITPTTISTHFNVSIKNMPRAIPTSPIDEFAALLDSKLDENSRIKSTSQSGENLNRNCKWLIKNLIIKRPRGITRNQALR